MSLFDIPDGHESCFPSIDHDPMDIADVPQNASGQGIAMLYWTGGRWMISANSTTFEAK